MNYNDNFQQSTAGIVKYSCGLLFMTFCFCYIYFIQGEILAEAQFVYSKGLTTYHEFASAVIVAIVLQIIQWVLSLIVRFPNKWYALSYFPSILLLAMLTDIDKPTILEFSFGGWVWGAPLWLLLYAAVVFAVKSIFDDRYVSNITVVNTLTSNYIILLVMFLGAGCVPDTSDVYHYELKTERLICEGKYEDATHVGETSLVSSVRLTQLRMFALAKEGTLAERIFSYPQYYGTKGLLDIHSMDSTNRIDLRDVCRGIGAYPHKSVRTTQRFLEIVVGDDSLRNKVAIDYYLCYLLLKKDLDTFGKEVFRYYSVRQPLPKAYQEALLYKAKMDGKSLKYISQEIKDLYHEYDKVRIQNLEDDVRRNQTRRYFGDTYWWYYDNQEPQEEKDGEY